jgi:hypothetical protein
MSCSQGDTACAQSCSTAHPNGASKFQSYSTCYQTCQSSGYCH